MKHFNKLPDPPKETEDEGGTGLPPDPTHPES